MLSARPEVQLSGRARGAMLVANDESGGGAVGMSATAFINAAFTELDVPRSSGAVPKPSVVKKEIRNLFYITVHRRP